MPASLEKLTEGKVTRETQWSAASLLDGNRNARHPNPLFWMREREKFFTYFNFSTLIHSAHRAKKEDTLQHIYHSSFHAYTNNSISISIFSILALSLSLSVEGNWKCRCSRTSVTLFFPHYLKLIFPLSSSSQPPTTSDSFTLSSQLNLASSLHCWIYLYGGLSKGGDVMRVVKAAVDAAIQQRHWNEGHYSYGYCVDWWGQGADFESG